MNWILLWGFICLMYFVRFIMYNKPRFIWVESTNNLFLYFYPHNKYNDSERTYIKIF